MKVLNVSSFIPKQPFHIKLNTILYLNITKTMMKQIVWCCEDCGLEAGGKLVDRIITWNILVCGVCGELKGVASPRDFGYPDFTV